MTLPQHIKIADYDYTLPDERIAKFPVTQRAHSKLLIYQHGNISEDIFYNISRHLPKGPLIVFNNTRVIQARLHFHKETGALIEVFLLQPAEPADYQQVFQTQGKCTWHCLIGNLKKWKQGSLTRIITDVGSKKTTIQLSVTRHQTNVEDAAMSQQPSSDSSVLLDFTWKTISATNEEPGVSHPASEIAETRNASQDIPTFADILESIGELPIPPYLNRNTQESDKISYQTVYARIKGSVAAPTAGLHFDKDVLKELDQLHFDRDEITLHVGAGTFKPVKTETMQDHHMHTEVIVVKKSTIENLIRHQAQAIAVGTTAVRTLESLYYIGCRLQLPHDALQKVEAADLHIEQWEPYTHTYNLTAVEALENIIKYLEVNQLEELHTSTQIIIAPSYEFKIVKVLITNFHQPQSTLLLLVSAFVKGDWRKIYQYALNNNFRFLSYGDSSLLIP